MFKMEVIGRAAESAAMEGLDVQLQGLAPDKNNDVFWMGGVMSCFSSLFSLFGGPDLKPSKEDNWEVPYDAITDMVYLGCGAQADVFSGLYKGEIVAVKKLRDNHEINLKHLRKLNHDNIVRFRGVCTIDPNFWVIMEYCQYGPLSEFLHSGACFDPKQILKWAKEIANGMAYLHQHKIIHRDLKSPNILIADNLVVKVSDFGTSREWNDGSAIMSFTGTVAWMAPEMIRHERCSERVDVWSYGVVLWELLTQEMPYKNLEPSAVMWGVGTDTIALTIPSTIPDILQLLIRQCWNRTPKYRPPFKIILSHLDVAGEELCSIKADSFNAAQATWRKEVQEGMDNFYLRSDAVSTIEQYGLSKREELQQAREARQIYEEQMTRANAMFLEVCAVRLQLEQRECALNEREKALTLRACRCGVRKALKLYQRQTSSSSEKQIHMYNIAQRRRLKRKQQASQMVVNCIKNNSSEFETVTVAIDACACDDVSLENNNMEMAKIETVVEKNGNIDVVDSCDVASSGAFNLNDNFMPDVAQV